MLKYLIPMCFLWACGNSGHKERPATKETKADSVGVKVVLPDTLRKTSSLAPVSDSLNAMACLIGGTWNGDSLYGAAGRTKSYRAFAAGFSKRWKQYDTTRLATLARFRDSELSHVFKKEEVIFYPFSGPDILYPGIFFPDAKKYVMVGLEPVGTFPDFSSPGPDSLEAYYDKLNSSLYAILQFSFFRTLSMRNDLKSGELDGVMHVLFLFLNRTGKSIVSAKPISLDTLGNKIYFKSFEELSALKLKTKGIEVLYNNDKGKLQELNYFSLDAADFELKKNKGFINYMQNTESFSTYLKGASYLLHRPYFSVIRNLILKQSNALVQDDSGIALKYLLGDTARWSFALYGEYSKPISKFSKHYQPNLDSLYKKQGAKKLDFGIGYNYRDKNSNFMVATRNKRGD